MDNATTAIVVTSFNDCINRSDIYGLSRLMTDDHVFIDSANNTTAGKESCVQASKGFFAAFPDYRNHFDRVLVSDGKVAIVGHSVCSDMRLAGPSLWSAVVMDGLIAKWRVYEDTSANRALLGIEG